MRFIHTADWHLGHNLHTVSRVYEHQQFLAWLLVQLQTRESDALIIAGDIFDSANPPASAQALFYQFLQRARQTCPGLDIVIIAGNHDSAARLEAPAPLLREYGVHVVGGIGADPSSLLIPLRTRDNEIAAWCAAVPFVRAVDLIHTEGDLIAGVREIYARILEQAFAQARHGEAVIATGHCYLSGTHLSELSERKILGGNQHALPLDIFPSQLNYTALGHLHLAQCVGGRAQVRYSGSPIPLSLAEATYPHQVIEVDLKGGHTVLRIPRTVAIVRQPEAQTLDDALTWLHEYSWDDLAPECWPFLELHIVLDKPQPGLRAAVARVIENKAVRLLKITPHYTGTGAALGDSTMQVTLSDLDVEQVFLQRWQRDHSDAPSAALLNAFHQLLDSVQA
jgi:DNA repair protein SbcD/Mre11